MASRIPILPAAGRELLYRLTESLEIPFTLTDHEGVVVASTAGRPAGQVDTYAIAVVRDQMPREVTAQELLESAAIAHPGLLEPAPGVYMPVRMNGRIAGALFARGEPDDVRTVATSAAAVAGLTLEFASTATTSVRETLSPDIALRSLLRGSHRDARKALLMVKVAGWDLLVPRVALVIAPADPDDSLPDSGLPVVRELLNAVAPHTPVGRLAAAEWVALPALPTNDAQPSVAATAAELAKTLTDQGLPVVIGLGETHIDLPVMPGLRRSYREAAFCADWARRLGVPPGVHSLRSLGPIAFLAPGPSGRQRYATALLQPLRDAPEILATVRLFLESDLSLEAAAKSSGQHRHTVRSHLQRARDLTGLDPRNLSDALQLKLALLLAPGIQAV